MTTSRKCLTLSPVASSTSGGERPTPIAAWKPDYEPGGTPVYCFHSDRRELARHFFVALEAGDWERANELLPHTMPLNKQLELSSGAGNFVAVSKSESRGGAYDRHQRRGAKRRRVARGVKSQNYTLPLK